VASEPVDDCAALKTAVQECGKDGSRARRRYLIKRSIELGCPDNIPDDWELEIEHGNENAGDGSAGT
jgi:hypothetical protein